MPIIRIALLLVVLGGLTLLLGQNWSPVLPLVFLGAKTQALPLAIWILLSIAAGAVTSLLITGLFKLANYFAPPLKRRRPASPRRNAQKSQARYTTGGRPSTKPDTKTPSNTADDWSSNSTTDDDDWGFEGDTEKTRDSKPNDVKGTYEVSSQPKSNYQAGAYSYSDKEPANSSVGKTESVYDADYRVLTPPYRQPDTDDQNDGFSVQPSVTTTTASPQPDTNSTPSPTADDWDSDFNEDDCAFEDETPVSDPVTSTYEVSSEPKSGSRSGSVYSYSYREGKSDVGSKSVSDADYQVMPPNPESDTTQNDDDWGFGDDNEFEDGDRSQDIKRRDR